MATPGCRLSGLGYHLDSMATSEDDLDPLLSTAEIIEEARRPLLIERHRPVLEEMESGLSDALVSGDLDHPRLAAMLRELEEESEQARVSKSIALMAEDEHYSDMPLSEAIVDLLCLQRENHNVEVAALQLHAIGIYRRIRTAIAGLQSLVPTLEELRDLPTNRLGRLLNPIEPHFGSPTLQEALVFSPGQADSVHRAIRRIGRGKGGDSQWVAEDDAPPLPREVEAPLEKLPPEQRAVARERLIQDRTRSRFYRKVFLKYLDRDLLSPEEVAAHRTVLHWLESIEETPHLYPFMQGLTPQQKRWRLACLLRKILALNEIYQRVVTASDHPSYRDRFAGLATRERLTILAKDHFPAMPVTTEFTIATMLCPFQVFATWVQDKVANKDFVLPPDPKPGSATARATKDR